MTTRRTLGLLAATTTALAVMPLGSAMADDTTTTFTLTGGDLTLSVQGAATLTDADSGTTTITGTLGAVSVTDGRGGTTGWSVSAGSDGFDGVLGSSSTSVSYTAGSVAETGTITVADGATTVIDAPAAVVTPVSLSGNNTAAWDPTLDVTMPAGALADDYTGVVTTSFL